MGNAFHEWIIDLYWDRMPCACTTGDLSDKEREVFVSAAAAYFYGCQHYKTLEFQSENPENWDDLDDWNDWDASKDVPSGEFIRDINEIAPVKQRDAHRPTVYARNLFVRVMKRDYKSMTGKEPKPPSYDKACQQDRPSAFSALCDNWAHMLDPDLPSPILSRTGYRKIFDAAFDR